MNPIYTDYEDDDIDPLNGLMLPPAAIQRNQEVPPDEQAVSRIRNIVGHLSSHFKGQTGPSLLQKKVTQGLAEVRTPEEISELQTQNEALKHLSEELQKPLVDFKHLQKELKKGPLSLDQLEKLPIPQLPNPALEAVTACCNKETALNRKIKEQIGIVKSHQASIQKLQKLTSMINKYKEGEEITQEMKDLIEELNNLNIDIGLKGEVRLNKEQIENAKSLTREHQESLRTNIQIIFQTEIQVMITTITTILEVANRIIQFNNATIRAANRVQGKG